MDRDVEQQPMGHIAAKQKPSCWAMAARLGVLVFLQSGAGLQVHAAQPGGPGPKVDTAVSATEWAHSAVPPAPPGPYTPIPDSPTGAIAPESLSGMSPGSGPKAIPGSGAVSAAVGGSIHGRFGMSTVPYGGAAPWMSGPGGYGPPAPGYARMPTPPRTGYPPSWPGYGAYGPGAPPGVGAMGSPYWRPPIGPAW